MFRPIEGDTFPASIESGQVSLHAGHRASGGRVLGDRQNVEITRTAIRLGWQPPAVPGRFDMLPLVIRDGADQRSIHPLPDAAWRRIAITHPTLPDLDEPGLQWYAVPCVPNM